MTLATLTVGVDVLSQTNAFYKLMVPRWERYRAFTGDLETADQKKGWLPKGAREFDEDYSTRVRLTHNVGWSEWSVDRMSGTLTKNPANVTWPEKSTVPEGVRTRVSEFMKNADGQGRSLSSWWTDEEPEALAMGVVFFEMVKEDQRSLPYLTEWKAEEVIDWGFDARGVLDWVVLYRTVRVRAAWDKPEQEVRTWRVLTKNEGMELTALASDKEAKAAAHVEGSPWTHNLGMVPLVPHYARRGKQPMLGRSYIDAISRADLRNLQLESDQSMASYLHGSPVMKVWTNQQLATVGVGSSNALKFKPGGDGASREDAEYLAVDPAGMQVREGIIDRTTRQAFTVAGIDPQSVAGPSGTRGPRSGSSIAWGFSTGEAPTLTSLSEEMDCADKLIIELVVRYESIGGPWPADQKLSDVGVVRSKEWDMMAAGETVTLGRDVLEVTPSLKHKRAIVKAIAGKVPGNLPQEQLLEINSEIDSASEERLDRWIRDLGGPSVDKTPTEEDEGMRGGSTPPGEPMMDEDEMAAAMAEARA